MGDRPLRLFVAVRPPRRHVDAVAGVVRTLEASIPGARWADAANLHVTLKFLGATPPDALDAVVAACRTAAARPAPSEVAIAGLGAFPSVRRARVVWAGVRDPDRLLRRLAGRLDRKLAPLGFIAEKREFHAHLTLARLRAPAPVGDALAAASLPELDPFTVSEIVLYRSHLSPRGARYEAVAAFPVGSPGA